jgi:hypothetical protein
VYGKPALQVSGWITEKVFSNKPLILDWEVGFYVESF